MPSTEFLLYLVTVIFVVYMIMNYYKESSHEQPEIQYKYIPVYKSDDDNTSDNNRRRNRQNDSQSEECGNPSCRQYGQCMCGGRFAGGMRGPGGPGAPGGPIGGPVGPVGGPGAIPPPPIDPLRKFDHDAVHDEFTPPFRRSYYDEYNYRLHPGLYPTYTRGPPGRFRKIGTLVAQGVGANDKYKFLHLMGREKYPGRDFEYYASSANVEQKLKFYIETKGKEIHDEDIVTIPELEGYTYRFSEDQDLSPRYDPYIL